MEKQTSNGLSKVNEIQNNHIHNIYIIIPRVDQKVVNLENMTVYLTSSKSGNLMVFNFECMR